MKLITLGSARLTKSRDPAIKKDDDDNDNGDNDNDDDDNYGDDGSGGGMMMTIMMMHALYLLFWFANFTTVSSTETSTSCRRAIVALKVR